MKVVVLHSCFLLAALCSWCQKGSVQLIIEPEEVGVNQQLTITLKSNVEGNVVENWPSNFVKGYGMQSMSRYVQDVNTGKMVQEHILVFTGVFTKTGKHKVGPFYVKAGNKTYPSNTVKVNVVTSPTQNNADEISKQQMRQPAFGIIEVSSNKIYEGEPLIIAGRVYSRERTFGRPILRRPFAIEGVNDGYALQQSEIWENVTLKRKNYESFSFEKKVIFPVGSGTLTIHPFEIYLPFGGQDFNVISSVPTVEVLPLPPNPPSEFIGAVGEFEVIQNCQSQKVKQGDIIQVEVVVSGKGNLHAIETPALPLPKGMNTYGDAEVKEDYIFNSQGAVGKVVYTYHVQVTKEGDQTIKPVKIAYFNPKEEKYVSVSAPKSITVAVKGNPQFELDEASDTTALANQKAEQKNLIGKTAQKLFSKDSGWIWYSVGGLLLISGIVFLVIFKKSKQEKTAKQQPVFKLKNIEKGVSVNQAKEAIQQVSAHLRANQNDQFYAAMERALITIMKWKLKQSEESNLSRNELLSLLKEQNDASVTTVQQLFEKCDYARYGIAVSGEEQAALLNELERLV